MYQRNGIWYADVIVNGKRLNRSLKTRDRDKAKYLENQIRQRMLDESEARDMHLKDAAERIYEEQWCTNANGETQITQMLRIVEILGNIKLSTLNRVRVIHLRDKLKATGIADTTVNRYVAALRRVWKVAKTEWELELLRDKSFQFPMTSEDNARFRTLTHEEEKEIIRYFRKKGRDDLADLIVVLIDTGCRMSEILKAKHEHLKEQGTLYIPPGNTKRKKGGRVIPLTERAEKILKARTFDHLEPSSVCRSWSRYRKHKGIHDAEFVPHALRHTCATRMIDAGVDLYEVQRMLGHSTISVTQRYAKMSGRVLQHAVSKLEEFNRRNSE